LSQPPGNQVTPNAYDDYIEAATAMKKAPQLRAAIEELLNADSAYLELSRRAVSFGRKPIDLILKAERKPFSAGPLTVESYFPTVELKRLGTLVAARAYVCIADGEAENAVRLLSAGMVFGDRISRLSTLTYSTGLSAMTSQLITIAHVASRLDLTTLGHVKSALIAIIESRPRLGGAASRDVDMYSASADLFVGKDWSKWMSPDNKDEERILSALDSASAATRSNLAAQLRRRLIVIQKRLEHALEGPLAAWHNDETLDTTSLIDLIISKLSVGLDNSYIRSEQVLCVRLRLARLTILVEEFRLVNRRLPTTLGLITDDAASTDPLTKTRFAYEVLLNGYDLQSRGTSETGVIRIDSLYRNPD
jgi:hypothetical protein